MELFEEFVTKLNLQVVESLDVPGRSERRTGVPPKLTTGAFEEHLSALIPHSTLWSHQSLALEHLCEGRNVVVSTGTASGKSLIFQLFALRRLIEDSNARVLVFYPLKALASDQHARWKQLASTIGLDPSTIVRIDGDQTAFRAEALENGRVVLMTPDVCQAWLMRTVGSSLVRRFLEGLTFLVLDEAHVYESVFGSNVAFLLRRMISAKRRISRSSDERKLQVIATTATIADPADHLNRLTGLQFSVVNESDNGAPQFPRKIVHVNGAEYGSAGEAALLDLVRGIHGLSDRHRFIAFMDSRQGIERIVRSLSKTNVLPYRSGYEAGDRQKIETALRVGTLDGVIATSALELGIDIADMSIGINMGVPQSRKAFRQRIGRVGRSVPGMFFVIALPNAFKRFGQTFKEYYQGSVEPSYLYLGNRFIQFAHARCLLDETEVLGGDQPLLTSVHWPDGFDQVLKFAKPGGGRPREFDFIAQLGADAPHFNYPLRQVGEASFQIMEGAGGDFATRLGNIAAHQAIREAYPGANYLHFGHAYKVLDWSTRSYDRSIRVTSAKNPVPTRALLRKTVTLSLASDGIVGGRLKSSPTGLVAEVHLQVNESVEGYAIGSTTYLYKNLRAENPNMSRKQRDFRTTGVLIKIDEPWFAGTRDERPRVRERVAGGLLGLICRDKSISPQDVDATHTNIALLTETGPRRLTDAIVIYDSVYGGLRLTEDLFVELSQYFGQLGRAADLAGGDALVSDEVAESLKKWATDLTDGSSIAPQNISVPDGWYQVYKPGSVVSVLFNGNLVERELIEPRLADPFGTGTKTLVYRYQLNGGLGFVPHDQVQPTGQDWSWILWNPDNGQYDDLEQPDV